MHTMLFSKRGCAKDLGPYNMMVDATGRVLQVDMSRQTSRANIDKYNRKGLQTSHTLSAYVSHAKSYAVRHPNALADFMRALVNSVPLAEGVQCELFDEAAMHDARHDPAAFVRRWERTEAAAKA